MSNATALPDIVELHGFKVELFPDDPEIIQRAFRYGWYERDEVNAARAIIDKSDRVLELGSGLGVVACAISSIVGAANMVGFEPNGSVAARARRNLALNGFEPRIEELICRPAAAGGTSSDFYIADIFWASSRDAGKGKRISVPVTSLEDEIAAHRANVLVMDIEGGEIEILERADLSPIRAIIFESHEKMVGRRTTNNAIAAALARGFLINFQLTTAGIVVLVRD